MMVLRKFMLRVGIMGNRELLFSVTKKDLVIEWYNCPGAGGQHKNKHANACRLKHPASGASAQCQDGRERPNNLKTAFRRLINTHEFKMWQNRMASELMANESVEQSVERMMSPENIRTEIKDGGKWKELKQD